MSESSERLASRRAPSASTRCSPRRAASSHASAIACASPGSPPTRRTLRPGELFVAIRGATHDGHQYLDEAARRGAGAVLVGAAKPWISALAVRRGRGARDARRARRSGRLPSPPAARARARRHRQQRQDDHQGDAGGDPRARRSARTPCCTRAARRTISSACRSRCSASSESQRVAVARARHERSRRGVAARRDRRSPTSASSRASRPSTWRASARCTARREAKAELFRRLRPSATAVVNADDPLVVAAAADFPGRVVRFGTDGDVRAEDVVDRGLDGSAVHARASGADATPVRLPRPRAAQRLQRARRRRARARSPASRSTTCARRSRRFEPPSMRMQVERLAERRHRDQRRLQRQPGVDGGRAADAGAPAAASRRLAVLGEMRELGDRDRGGARGARRVAAAARLDAAGRARPARRRWCATAPSPRACRPTRIVVAARPRRTRARGLRDFCRSRRPRSCSRARAARASSRCCAHLGQRRTARDALRAALRPPRRLGAAARLQVHHVPDPGRRPHRAHAVAPARARASSAGSRRCRSASRSASDGPARHQKKAGTPTMGGMLILFSLALATLLLADLSELVRLDRARGDARRTG